MKEIFVKKMKHTDTNETIYQPILTMVDNEGAPCFIPQDGMKLGMIIKDNFDKEDILPIVGAEILPIADKTFNKLSELMDVLQVQLTKTQRKIKPEAEALVHTYKNIENQLNTMLPFGHSDKEMDVDEIVEFIVCEHIQGKQTEVCLDEHENICTIDTSLLEEDLLDDYEDNDDCDEDDEEIYDGVPDIEDIKDTLYKMSKLSQKRK